MTAETAFDFGPNGPELTFPKEVSDVVCAAYDAAEVIVEYGSGGSTVYGASQAGKTLYSVESSKDWHARLKAYFTAQPAKADLHLFHADIGPTGDWGWPNGAKGWQRYPDYCFGVWQHPGLQHPDVVLIDGRFRMGCFMATLVSISRPTRVLFDDYANRRDIYGAVETFAPVYAFHGRMAEFVLLPHQNLPAGALFDLLKLFQVKT